jgi:cellulose 1,4-beta-cellobiosidase
MTAALSAVTLGGFALGSAPAAAASHVDNPYADAVGYLNPDYVAAVKAEAAAAGGTLGTQMAAVANYPTAIWMDRIAAVGGGSGVTRTLAGHLDAALAQQTSTGKQVVITVVVYDLPNRDCSSAASSGELTVANDGLNKYKSQFIDPIAAAMSNSKYANLRIVTVLEPDSLPNLITNLGISKCAEADSSGAYVQGVQYALNKLHAISNVYTYLDISHSGWLGWDTNFTPFVSKVTGWVKGTTAGVNSLDGFISNTANYTPTAEPFMPDSSYQMPGYLALKGASFYEWNPHFDEATYGAAMRAAFVGAGFPSTIGMLIDTSRNGWGGSARPSAVSTSTDLNTFVNASKIDRRVHRGGWCNQDGAGIGTRPTVNPLAGFDAFVWVKPPGESDGTSDTSATTANSEGKLFDPMCNPAASSKYNSAFKTGAMSSAPHAGHWFSAQFKQLVQNAYPALTGGSTTTTTTTKPATTTTTTKPTTTTTKPSTTTTTTKPATTTTTTKPATTTTKSTTTTTKSTTTTTKSTTTTTSAAAGLKCTVTKAVGSSYTGGFQANISVKNTGTVASGNPFKLTFTLPSGQSLAGGWGGATLTASGTAVTATGSAALAAGATASFTYQANASSATLPSTFALNGTTCS